MNEITSILHTYYLMAVGYAPRVLLGAVTFLLGFWAIQRISEYITALMQRAGMEPTVSRFLSSLLNLGLKVMLLLSIAGMLGIHTTSFIAVFTALAFAIGTALSGNIGHFASGVMILIFRPYKAGDYVTIQNNYGKVLEIQVFTTTILTNDNRKIIIPNGLIMSGVITNFSHQGNIRNNISVFVADNTDFEKVKNLILKVADECPICLKNPVCGVLVKEFNKNGLEILVRPWCHPNDASNISYYFQEHIRRVFIENGIEGPVNGVEIVSRNNKIN